MEKTPISSKIAASRKVDQLKKKIQAKKSPPQVEDLKVLWEMYCSDDLNVVLMVCDAVLFFVKSYNISIPETISWLISSLQSTNQVIVKVVCDLMILSVQRNTWEMYDSSVDILQHPLNLILQQECDSWSNIEYYFKFILCELGCKCTFSVMKPVFIFALWSPTSVKSLYKRAMWNQLITHIEIDVEFLILNFCWLKMDDQNNILNVTSCLDSVMELEILLDEWHLKPLMSVLYVNAACNLAAYGFQPEQCLNQCKKILEKDPTATDLILLIIARALSSCPISYLHLFVKSSIDIILMNKVSSIFVLWTLVAALLPWIYQSSDIFHSISNISQSIFTIAEKNHVNYLRNSFVNKVLGNKFFMKYAQTDSNIFCALAILRKFEKYSMFISVTEMSNMFMSKEDMRDNYSLNYLISSVLLENHSNAEILEPALELLLKNNAGPQLPLILFLLSRSTCPKCQLSLLYSLPLTAIDENNMPPIFRTIESLTSIGIPIMSEVSIVLHLELWKIRKRCYSHLSDTIQKNKVKPGEKNWFLDVITSDAIKKICLSNPTTYGKEWLPLLSDIMNRCSHDYEGLPLIDALTTILLLCEHKVVNKKTVYVALSEQKLFSDRRPEVVAKMCELVKAMFQHVTELNFDDHHVVIVDALKVMWNLVSEFRHKKIVVAALNALSSFPIGLMPLKVIPEIYWKEVCVPADLLKKSTPGDTPENIMTYIPGYIWISYLQNVREDIKFETCLTMSLWLQSELNQLGRGFYRSVRGEPNDVSFLHDKSIFKAVVKYLKRIAVTSMPLIGDTIRTAALCLMVLNNDTISQIPLFNWNFVEYYLKCENSFFLLNEVSRFLARQSGTSISANKCLQNYLEKIDTFTVEKLKILLDVLPQLCSHITPTVFAATMEPAFEKINALIINDEDLYELTCNGLLAALNRTDLDEHNRDFICREIIKLWSNIPEGNINLDRISQVIMKMPLSFIEHLIATDQHKNALAFEKIKKLMKLLYIISMTDSKTPFKWLDVLIGCILPHQSISKLFYLYSVDIIRKHRYHPDKWNWLLKFMHEMHQRTESSSSNENTDFLCDVIIFFFVTSSSLFPLIVNSHSELEYRLFFPQAVKNITFKEISSQVIELLYFMSKSEKISNEFKEIFKNALIAMKSSAHLQKLSNWSKIVSVF